jgi:hypothetical protein
LISFFSLKSMLTVSGPRIVTIPVTAETNFIPNRDVTWQGPNPISGTNGKGSNRILGLSQSILNEHKNSESVLILQIRLWI